MPRGLRRPHTKSRNGCLRCKARKVKCDCRGPKCGNCEKRGELCEYPEFIRVVQGSVQVESRSVEDGAFSIPALQPTSLFPADVQLLKHWRVSTSTTVGVIESSEMTEIWRVKVSGLAHQYPFLMQSVLGATAAHVARLYPSIRKEYLEKARRHHVDASKLFRVAAASAVKNDTGAVLAFCTLLIITSMALLQEDVMDTATPTLDSFIDWIFLLRRSIQFTRSVGLGPCGSQDVVGMFTPATERASHPPLPLCEAQISSLAKLLIINMACEIKSTSDKVVISQAIYKTKEWYQSVPLLPQDMLFIIRWVGMMTDEFFELLKLRDPLALALLAHYLVPVCHVAPKKWFLDHWPRKVVAAIVAELGLEWAPTITWVRQELNM